MNGQIVTQNQQQVNVKPITITSTPWAWGFEDGSRGESFYTGNHYFAGPKLGEYRKGWAEGQRVKAQRSN